MNGKHEVAIWAGVGTFFGTLLTIGVVDVLDPDKWIKYLSALIISFITAASVYAKQRYEDAKEAKERAANPPPTTYQKPEK